MSLDMPSRLKGIETAMGSEPRRNVIDAALDMPSRLKGIETQRWCPYRSTLNFTLDMPSRLKGIETISIVFVSETPCDTLAIPFPV